MGGVVIRSLLVANRGEIALRIARSCREMGVRTILAAAEDDHFAEPGRHFDEVVSLGSGESRETYLDAGRIIDLARRAGADAIHPGYGFLSERAELAAACADSEIIFVGPRADSIEAMGSKSESRKLMERLGVPVVPGYHGSDQSDEAFAVAARSVGFPLLVKASAGGGGKGMKIAMSEAELFPALDSARREAAKSFGDETLLLERYIERPRHVEVQVFGDATGDLVHLYERDCSVQRRHQKVIEESPAPHFPQQLREQMAESALQAARGVNYLNAGTVEFIVTPGGDFFFLEMNTRLQVEHPVTEAVVGCDLVRAQIEVAGGARLPWRQSDLHQRGHAIECRIYAEDPDNEFLPQVGTIARYREPSGPGVRIDSAISTGSEISIRYDPLLAKLIVHAENRVMAADRLVRAIDEFVLLGTTTNLGYLRRIVTHPAFRDGMVTTAFLAEFENDLRRPGRRGASAAAALIARPERAKQPHRHGPRIASVWEATGEWGRPATGDHEMNQPAQPAE